MIVKVIHMLPVFQEEEKNRIYFSQNLSEWAKKGHQNLIRVNNQYYTD